VNLSAFKAYDIRGRIPTELNASLAYDIGRAYAAFVKPKRVIVGRDIRSSSAELCARLAAGLADCGVDVYDIGLCGTEGVYFATFAEQMDGGIMVTASHNPPDYNGMKFVREGSRPISADTGLFTMRDLIAAGTLPAPAANKGTIRSLDTERKYLDHLLTYVDRSKLRPLKVVVNAGNGGAGLVVDALESALPFQFIKVHHQPDPSFPNGVPNPMIIENRKSTIDAIRANKADIGLAWDGDFDRCFFFDEQGTFIEGYYMVGLLAQAFLHKKPGQAVVYDPRLTWNTIDIVERAGGTPVMCRSGHAFIKAKMREVDAVYGGEMSAHHYFRDFAYCDSGMIPWLLTLQVLSEAGRPFSELLTERMKMFPTSGEINSRVPDAKAAIAAIQARYEKQAKHIDFTDGLSIEFEQWRLNLRSSNTEPLIRLNLESRADEALMRDKTREVLQILGEFGAVPADH
jgi:phosphomannomutase/phosphomannomutase/phosphoglucomutase